MPVVTVLPDRLEVRLSAAERILALHRADVVVDRASIRSATVTEDPWIWVRGIRAPGTAVPLTIAVGTWKFHGGKDFLLIKRSATAVVVDLLDAEYSRIIISTKHAAELIAALQLGTPTTAVPVVEERSGSEEGSAATPEPHATLGGDAAPEAVAAEEVPASAPAPGAGVQEAEAEAPGEDEPRAGETPAPRPTKTPKKGAGDERSSAEPSGATEAAE